MANWKEKRTKEQRDFHILRKLLLCLDLYFSRCVYRFPERDRDRDSPPIVTSHGNYFRCFRFCHDNCDLTETTVRNDCVATTFIHSRLPRPIHHYFGWDLESRCAPRLLRKENRRSARCLLPLSFRREKRVCRFNCPSFFQLFLFLFFFHSSLLESEDQRPILSDPNPALCVLFLVVRRENERDTIELI